MADFSCKCGLPEENHSLGRRGLWPAFGPRYANEEAHFWRCWNAWHEPKFPWGGRPYALTSRYSPFLQQEETLSLIEAHTLCNKTCPVYTLSGERYASQVFFDRAYAAWFHHGRVDTTRCRFLFERLECSAMDEVQGSACPENLERQTWNCIKALKPIHERLCEATEHRLNLITDKDKVRERLDFDEGWDEFQYGKVYTQETNDLADYSVMTHDHVSLRDHFAFEDSFKRFFIFIDEKDMEEKGITLVDLDGHGAFSLGEGWKHDLDSGIAFYRDKPGNVLELFLKLVGRAPSEHPEVMHGKRKVTGAYQ